MPFASSDSNLVRAATKTRKFEEDLRQRIVQGRLSPGERLPNRIELIEQFGVSSITVQQAFDGLIRDGFVEARGRAGTFVARHPPHRFQFAVVFPEKVSPRFPFWSALREVLIRRGTIEGDGVGFAIYEQVCAENPGPDQARLESDLRASRLAGVIVAANPSYLPNELLDLIDALCPAVAVMAERCPRGWPTVYFDYSSFLDRAITIAKAAGRRQLAAVCSRFTAPALASHFRSSAKSARLTLKPWWMMPIPPHAADAIPLCIQLLMNPEQQSRPDALIIADDALIHPALTGLIAAGVRVPDDLLLIGLSNSPSPANALPVERVYFDSSELLDLCLPLLNPKRRGKSSAPPMIFLPARLAHELPAEAPLAAASR